MGHSPVWVQLVTALHRMSEAQIKREAAVHALAWERTGSILPWQHIVVFRKRTRLVGVALQPFFRRATSE
jgi:hypothetical protein